MQRPKLTRKKKVIAGTVVGLLVVVGIGVWAKIAFDSKITTPEVTPIDNIGLAVSSFTDENDTDGALSYYDQQIALREQDDEQKKLLLVMKSQFARRMGKTKVAVHSAELAYEIEEGPTTTRELADAYLANGDKDQALIYYKKLKDLSSSAGKAPMMGGPSVEGKIKDIEQ